MAPRPPAPSGLGRLLRTFIALPLIAAMFSFANQHGITTSITRALGVPDVSTVKIPGIDKLVAAATQVRDARDQAVKAGVGYAWSKAEPELEGLRGQARTRAIVELSLRRLNGLEVKGRAPKTGYSREQFGREWDDAVPGFPYSRNGCDTRNDILKRDLVQVKTKPGSNGCTVTSGVLRTERYTGKTDYRFDALDGAYATDLDIEHLAPLSWAWQHGAAQWTPAKRASLANADVNLFAADPSSNRQKGDSGPAAWLPSNKAYRCDYIAHFVKVLDEYDLWINPADKAASVRVLEGCL